MAEETKSADPAPREAARNALDRMRTDAAANESDADSAINPIRPHATDPRDGFGVARSHDWQATERSAFWDRRSGSYRLVVRR